MAQQTAVDFLISVIIPSSTLPIKTINEFIEQAKAIEKEQMHKCASFWRGKENEIEKPIFEQYYNETYNK